MRRESEREIRAASTGFAEVTPGEHFQIFHALEPVALAPTLV
jgi:hypothetical protein